MHTKTVIVFSVLCYVGIVLLFYLTWINFTFSPPSFRVIESVSRSHTFCTVPRNSAEAAVPKGARGPNMLHFFFIFTQSATWWGRGPKKILSPWPVPVLGGPVPKMFTPALGRRIKNVSRFTVVTQSCHYARICLERLRKTTKNWSNWQIFQKKFAPNISLPQQQSLGGILLHHPAQPVRYVIFRSPCQASRCVYTVSVVWNWSCGIVHCPAQHRIRTRTY